MARGFGFMSSEPKKQFGGKQEGAGRKPLPDERKTYYISVPVDYDTYKFFQLLTKKQAEEPKSEAGAVLLRARIADQIID